jgi:hypothetical protein
VQRQFSLSARLRLEINFHTAPSVFFFGCPGRSVVTWRQFVRRAAALQLAEMAISRRKMSSRCRNRKQLYRLRDYALRALIRSKLTFFSAIRPACECGNQGQTRDASLLVRDGPRRTPLTFFGRVRLSFLMKLVFISSLHAFSTISTGPLPCCTSKQLAERPQAANAQVLYLLVQYCRSSQRAQQTYHVTRRRRGEVHCLETGAGRKM